MGLIKKISEMSEPRKKEKELKQEERLILREMAQERLNKKRALEHKQKVFDTMLDKRFPCESIIKLRNGLQEAQYFQIEIDVITMLLLLQKGITNFPCKFKQLTGHNAGKVYNIVCPTSEYAPFYSCYLNKSDISKLVVSIMGYRNTQLEQHFRKPTELEDICGETISLRELLIRWKADNRQFMDINIENDYDMVKQVYDSEDILAESKSEELSK